MFASLDVFKTAHAMAVHAGHRQALVAENIANADTPEYRARDLASFGETYANPSATLSMKASRNTHLFGIAHSGSMNAVETGSNAAANGNTVSIEEQMLQAVDVKRQHDRAIAIYKSALTVLRGSISRN